jgi:hypothetical protein
MSELDSRSDTEGTRTGFLGMAAILATALVGFNTLVISCSTERASRDAAQLHQIEERERFWTDAMRELSDVLRARAEAGNSSSTTSWELRCRLLAQRTAPFVEDKARESSEAADGEIELSPVLLALDNRVFALQKAFVDQISNSDLVGFPCATIYQSARHDNIDARRDASTIIAGAGAQATAVTEAITARQDLIELTPLSDTGWDIDVFWCERSNEPWASDQNFTNALDLGRRLLREGRDSGGLDGHTLGRIRIRMLASFLQVEQPYSDYASSRYLVWETSQDEEKGLAEAIITRLDRGLEAHPVTPGPSIPVTEWYVSVFYCGAGTPPPPATYETSSADAAKVAAD